MGEVLAAILSATFLYALCFAVMLMHAAVAPLERLDETDMSTKEERIAIGVVGIIAGALTATGATYFMIIGGIIKTFFAVAAIMAVIILVAARKARQKG